MPTFLSPQFIPVFPCGACPGDNWGMTNGPNMQTFAALAATLGVSMTPGFDTTTIHT